MKTVQTKIIEFLAKTIKNSKWENKVFLAGGYIRDELLGLESKDIDLVIEAENGGIEFANWITKVLNIHKDTNPILYPRFGTAMFTLRGIEYQNTDLSNIDIEVVMTRKEQYTNGSRKPVVQFGTLKEDAYRRDFTINSLMKNLTTNEIMDLTNRGMSDLKHGIIRTPLDPNITFKEDPLRMLRAIRFTVKYNWKLPFYMLRALRNNASQLETISAERIQEELNKILITENPDQGIRLIQITGLNKFVIPELDKLIGLEQNKYHVHGVYTHTLQVLKNTPADLVTRLGALFHDIGKAKTKTIVNGEIHFYKHDEIGATITRHRMNHLRYSTEMISSVICLVENHMRLKQSGPVGEQISNKALRKLKRDLGQNLEPILELMHADNVSHAIEHTLENQIAGIRNRLDQLNNEPVKPILPINGKDIIEILKLSPGPIFKTLLKAVENAWFENPELSREEAIQILKENYDRA